MKKKVLTTLFLITSYISIAFGQGVYEELTQIKEVTQEQKKLVCGSTERPILLAGFMNYPPFGWKESYKMEGNGGFLEKEKVITNYFGIGMELFDKFAKEYNFVYSFVNMLNFDEAKYALSKGHFDVLLNNYYDSNSYSTIRYFYPGYISNPVILVVRKPKQGEKIPETLEELRGKKGFVRSEENLYGLLYPQIPTDVDLKQVNGVRRAFQALLREEVDFLVMSQLAYETEIRRFKIKEFVSASSTPLIAPVVFFSYAQDNTCAEFIKEKFEKKLNEYTQNKDYMRSVLSSYLIKWENKFMNEKSLMYEIDVMKNETEEKTDNLDAWLNQQKEEKEMKEKAKQTKKPKSKIGI